MRKVVGYDSDMTNLSEGYSIGEEKQGRPRSLSMVNIPVPNM